MATVWISAFARRNNINETNELNIILSLEENITVKTEFKFFLTV